MELVQHRWVQQFHLNAAGYMFGGFLLSWVDEDAMMLAYNVSDGQANYVTAGMERVQFLAPISQGARLKFKYRIVYVGKTSLWIHCEIFNEEDDKVFVAFIALTSIDRSGRPKYVSLVAPDLHDKVRKDEYWHYVELLREWQGKQ
jgi:acyl-CoA hydrolase